jgi:uncharacterized protein YxjI
MKTNFFESNTYFIDEKVGFLKFENAYQIFDGEGTNIGAIKQKLTGWQKVLRLLMNKAMLPFLLEIKDNEDKLVASISRGWTFFMSKIVITNAQGESIGTVKQKFKLFKPTFQIFDNAENLVAEINGDWTAWNFTIKDASENQIGTISKKWAGAMKELLTTADKYNVRLEAEDLTMNHKIAVLSAAITIDMILKESKEN